MPEALLLLLALAVAGGVVLAPLWRSPADASPPADDELEAAALRHWVAMEALRDVETDRRAGSLDDAGYAEQLADAEARAATTRAGLGQIRDAQPHVHRRGRPAVVAAAGLIALLLVAGSLVPATGIANQTVINERLAAAQQAEADRQDRIAELRGALAEDPSDSATLSALADAHLAGSSAEDLSRAAAALQLLIALEPDRADAYERIVAAYLRAGDHPNARAALTSYAERSTADPAEIAFFDGLIALRGEDDAERARAAFDRFLELAPDDPRAPMIRGLRDDAR